MVINISTLAVETAFEIDERGNRVQDAGLDMVIKMVLCVSQMDDSIIYLNIPTEPKINDIELTEEELEVVSGGTAHVCFAAVYYAWTSSYGCAAVVAGAGAYLYGRFGP